MTMAHVSNTLPPSLHVPPCPLNLFSSADLGYDASESYGISYKARGLCKDQTNLDIYDDDNGLNVGVTGDIINSILHHNVGGSTLMIGPEQPHTFECIVAVGL